MVPNHRLVSQPHIYKHLLHFEFPNQEEEKDKHFKNYFM